jgi:ADP-sugar diphosphatase
VVKLFLARADVDVNLTNKNGQSPLSIAVLYGREAIVNLFLDRADVDVNLADENGQSPLSIAVLYGREAIVNLFLDRADVDVNLADEYGETLLWKTASQGHKETVKLFLAQADIDVNLADNYNQTPLWGAASEGHEAVVKLFLDRADIDVNLANRRGETLLSIAALYGREAVVKLFLNRADVDVNLADNYSQTPLSEAAPEGHETAVKLFLDRADVDVNLANRRDRPDVFPTVPVTLAPGLDLSKAQLLAFPAFKVWLKTLRSSLALQKKRDHSFHKTPYGLRSIHVQSVDFFGPRIGFMKIAAEVTNDNGEKLPGIVLLRGGNVAMLIILRPTDKKDERWVVVTAQPRIAAGSLSFYEIPAGIIDDFGIFIGAAAKKIEEETGFSIPQDELVDMTEIALKSAKGPEQHLQAAMYPSPSGCDEYIPLLL